MLDSSEAETDSHIAGEQEAAVDEKDVESPSLARKPRRKRRAFLPEQVNKLELYFRENSYPSLTEREGLSRQLEIEESAISTWFKNKRSRVRDLTKNKEPMKGKKRRSRVTVITAAAATTPHPPFTEETIGIHLKDIEGEEKEEEKKMVQDEINKNPLPQFEDVSVYEFPVFEYGRTEVTEAFEPILLKILSAPPF